MHSNVKSSRLSGKSFLLMVCKFMLCFSNNIFSKSFFAFSKAAKFFLYFVSFNFSPLNSARAQHDRMSKVRKTIFF